MSEFEMQFDPESFASLDEFALLARQDYNLGGAGDWFGEFRGGLYGFYARLHGVQRHYTEVHAWFPRIRHPEEVEYHLASILFQMDSALECLTFALNALGWAAMPCGFRDVADGRALRRIGPLDVLGDADRSPPLAPLSGYGAIYPSLQATWQGHVELIDRIRVLHDVSKHRRTIYVGGKKRMDAPEGFYDSLGIMVGSKLTILLSPEAEIVLKSNPKSPSMQRSVEPPGQRELLEHLVPAFEEFINNSGAAALADAKTNVLLNEKKFSDERKTPPRKFLGHYALSAGGVREP